MTTYNNKKSQDIKNGLRSEKKVIKLLSKLYKDIEAVEDTFSPIDFISHKHKICFEMKSTQQSDLKSYRFGFDKYQYYSKNQKKQGYSFVLIYYISGTIAYCTITNPKKNHRVINWGRSNRGRQEVTKKYVIVAREDFAKFKFQFKKRQAILPLDHFVDPIFTMLVDED